MKKSVTQLLLRDFEKAVARLEEALRLKPTRIHKDATIQRFEFCFELSWKVIQRFLREQGIECRSPKDCFRRAADFSLFKNPKPWFAYLEARNLVSHIYRRKAADRIYKKSESFSKAAKMLIGAVKEYL
jgi:nucleotidyltransferase substrate binding protein (TIGR01987 family)